MFRPAIAGAGGRGTFGVSSLGTRHQKYWFAVVGLIALSLPYGAALAASVRGLLDTPPPAVAMPTLNVPVAQFPTLAVPKLHSYVAPAVPKLGPPPASSTARAGSTTHPQVVRHTIV